LLLLLLLLLLLAAHLTLSDTRLYIEGM